MSSNGAAVEMCSISRSCTRSLSIGARGRSGRHVSRRHTTTPRARRRSGARRRKQNQARGGGRDAAGAARKNSLADPQSTSTVAARSTANEVSGRGWSYGEMLTSTRESVLLKRGDATCVDGAARSAMRCSPLSGSLAVRTRSPATALKQLATSIATMTTR